MIDVTLKFTDLTELSSVSDAISTYLTEHTEDPDYMIQAVRRVLDVLDKTYYENSQN